MDVGKACETVKVFDVVDTSLLVIVLADLTRQVEVVPFKGKGWKHPGFASCYKIVQPKNRYSSKSFNKKRLINPAKQKEPGIASKLLMFNKLSHHTRHIAGGVSQSVASSRSSLLST